MRISVAIVPYVVGIALVPGLIMLGVWQLHRAAFKLERQQWIEQRAILPAMAVRAVPADPAALAFYRITARGHYEPARQFLLDNQIENAVAGYHVITPLRIAASDMQLLVDRGWVPWGPDRTKLPPVETPAGEIEVTGRASVPPARYFSLGADPATLPWQAVWAHLDLVRFARLTGHPVQPVVMLLSPQAPGGFVRRWPDYKDGWVQRHQAYAFQWFALAALVVVLMLRGVWRARRTAHDRA